MTTVRFREQLFAQTRAMSTVRRPGIAADLDGAADKNLFTVDGLCAIYYMFGVCTTLIGAGLCVPGIQFTPTAGAVQVALCLAAASIATDAAGTIYVWDGLVGGQLVPCAALGMAAADEGAWAGAITTLPAGVIELTGAVDALAGVIDWYVAYLPVVAGSTIVAAV